MPFNEGFVSDNLLDRYGYPDIPCNQCHPGTIHPITNRMIGPCPGGDKCPLYVAWRKRAKKDSVI
jgi:hypothetical protein